MYRSLFISIAVHVGLIAGLLILSMITPAPKKPSVMVIRLGPMGGDPNLPVGPGHGKGPLGSGGGAMSPATPPAAARPTPVVTPRPSSTQNKLKPAATPKTEAKPKPATKPVVKPAATPKTIAPPKPVASKSSDAKTKKPVTSKVLKPAEPAATKKVIHRASKDDKKLVEARPKATPTPTPEPTPAEVQGPLEGQETESAASDAQTAEAQATPEAGAETTVASAADVLKQTDSAGTADAAPSVNVGPPAATVGAPGGQPGQFASKTGTLSIGSGVGTPGGDGSVAGGGGGMGGLDQTYFMWVLAKIEDNFRPPQVRAGVDCRVRFLIARDGTVSNIQVVKSTGSPSWDQFAVQALEQVGKMPAPYDSFKESYLDVVVTFNYTKKS